MLGGKEFLGRDICWNVVVKFPTLGCCIERPNQPRQKIYRTFLWLKCWHHHQTLCQLSDPASSTGEFYLKEKGLPTWTWISQFSISTPLISWFISFSTHPTWRTIELPRTKAKLANHILCCDNLFMAFSWSLRLHLPFSRCGDANISDLVSRFCYLQGYQQARWWKAERTVANWCEMWDLGCLLGWRGWESVERLELWFQDRRLRIIVSFSKWTKHQR